MLGEYRANTHRRTIDPNGEGTTATMDVSMGDWTRPLEQMLLYPCHLILGEVLS